MPAAVPLAVAAVSYACARAQAGAAESAANSQERTKMEQLRFDREKYDRYKSIYGPLEEKEASEAMQDGPLDYGLIRSNIDRQYANLGRGMTEQANNSGMQGAGLDAAKRQGADIQHGEALSTAYGVGLMNRRNYRSSVMNHNQLPQAGNQYSSSLGSLSSMYGNWRDDANRASQSAWGGVASALGGLTRAYGSQQNQPKVPDGYGEWSSREGSQTGPYGDGGSWASVLDRPYGGGGGGGDNFDWANGWTN